MVVLGRVVIKFITLAARGGRGHVYNQKHGHLQFDENTCVSASVERFFTLTGLLQRRM